MLASRKLVTTILAAAVTFGGVTVAPTIAHAEIPSIGKVAMVDMQRVLNETKAGRKARKDLESSSKVKQQKLDKKRAKLEADAAKLQQMSGQQLAAAQEKLQQESMELQSMLYTLEQELSEQHSKLLEKMYRNSQDIVSELAKKHSLDMVLVKDQMTVIYTKKSLDITDEVVKLYDQRHKS